MMRMLMEMVLGFLVLQAAASPRFARQVELDTYDSANYDVDLENLNPDNQDIYDYEDGLTIDEPQIEIGTLAPPDYNYPAPGASLEEEEEEEQEEGLEEEEQEEDQEEGQEEEEQEEGQEEEEQEEGQEEEEQEEEELEEAQEEEELEEAQEEEELEEGQEEEEEQEEEQEIQLKVEEEVQLKPKLIPQGSGDSGILMGPDTQKGMPTCLLCTCLGGSVYCDDLKLSHVPPLPKDTTHFYARYNKITKINKSDFAEMNKLKRIDVTANEISSVADGAFTGLPVLEELIIRENAVAQLPALPVTMTLVDASHNNIGATGIHKEAFKDMAGLLYLYLTDNHIDHIPVPLPDSLRSLHLQRNNIQMMHEDTFCNLKDFNYIRNALEDIRLDGNPLNLSRTPQAYVCLPRVPVGDLI